jgi:ATP-dependent 26S proteasome regulatory subunit
VGQIIGEVLKQLDEERCKSIVQIVEAIGSVRHLSQMSRKFAVFCAAVFWRGPQVAVQFFADFVDKLEDQVNQVYTPVVLQLARDLLDPPILIFAVIVKASSGPRYVVGCRNKVDKTKLIAGTRVALDMTTLTIMRFLPREVRFVTYLCNTVMLQTSPLTWKN